MLQRRSKSVVEANAGANLAPPPAAARRASHMPEVMGTPRGGAVFKRPELQGKRMSAEEVTGMRAVFASFDADGSSKITVDELSAAMEKLGTPMPRDKVASMIREVDQDGSASVDFEEFLKVLERAKTTQKLAGFANIVHAQKATVMQVKKDNMVHSFAEEECVAFCDFVNNRLAHDPKLSYLLPIREMTDLFSVVADGVVLCKLVNEAVPETIDERAVNFAPRNPFHVTENHNLALEACKSVGMTVVNIGSSDLKEGRPHLVLGLVWQLVKMTLLQNINLKDNPNLLRLLQAGEELEELLKLPPEKLLLRWFNYHLEQAGSSKRINNYGPDLKDSEAYATLLKQIDPNKTANTTILSNQDLHKRAEYVINQGRRMGATGFTIQPADVVKGNDKLNLGFVAALFNACPALEPPDEEQQLALLEIADDDDAGDSREERAFRMWINSLGVETHVDNLFDDLRDGVVLLETMDHIKPGCVEWGRVNRNCKMVFKKIENANYAVDLGLKTFKFSLVGVQGKDIVDGNKKLTLALVWQLMRTHLIGLLASLRQGAGGGKALTDEDIVKWANDRVGEPALRMRDLHDKSLASGLFLIALLRSIEPRVIDNTLVCAGESDDEKKLNAKYAISSARKLGCTLFLLWEDIVDVRPKMILTFVATVMMFDLKRKA